MAKSIALKEPMASPSKNMIEKVYTGSAEETFAKSPLVPDSFKAPYNQDDLWQKTGSYSIYEDMIDDDQVNVCLQLKKDLVLGSGFDLISEEEDQEEISDFLHDVLDDSCLVDGAEEILTAYENGFSVTEKVFEQNDDGMTVLKSLKTRHPNSWLLHTDPKGNIIKFEQNTIEGYKDINPDSIIHYMNNPRYQNPYGLSDLRPCYAAWFAKRQVIRYYAIYLEKAASPTPVVKYNKNAPDTAITKIYNTIKKLQASTAMVIPDDMKVEFLEAKSNGEAYSKAINIFNMFIGRALFVPDLLGLTGAETGGGSHALGKEQMGLFFMHISRRRAALEKIINQHIIWPLIVTNFGFIKKYPKFKFKPIDDMKAIELAKVWVDAVKSKVFPPNDDEINYFRSLCKFPEGDVREAATPTVVGLPGQPVGPGSVATENKDGKAGAKPGENVPGQKETTQKTPEAPADASNKNYSVDDEDSPEYAKQLLVEIDKLISEIGPIKEYGGPGSGRYPAGSGGSESESSSGGNGASLSKASSNLKVALDREQQATLALKNLQASVPMGSNSADLMNSQKYKDVASEYHSAVRDRQRAVREAKKEIISAKDHLSSLGQKKFGKVFNLPPGDYYKKCDFKKIGAKFKDYDNSIMIEAGPVVKKQMADLFDQIQKKNILKSQDISRIDKLQLKYLKELKQILKGSFTSIYKDGQMLAQSELMKNSFRKPIAHDAFLDMLEEETFQYIGDYQYTILKRVRAELIAAVKDGRPLSDVEGVLSDELDRLSEVSIERFARTKHTEAMNKGRMSFFEDSGVVAAYQYSAILDDVTSEICAGLDGKIFEAGSEPIPPLHFNCRSMLIPITKYEDFSPSEKAGGMPIDQFIEENKGSGFSKYTKGAEDASKTK